MSSHTLAGRVLELVDALRRGGMAVGSGESLLASTAVEAVGIDRIADLRAALAATLVRQVADRPFFDAAFAAVILAPPESEPPEVPVPGPRAQPKANRRLQAAQPSGRPPAGPEPQAQAARIRAASDLERLVFRDFEQMSVSEALAARDLVRSAASWWRRPVRRWEPSPVGRSLDVRRIARDLARRPDGGLAHWRRRRTVRLKLVFLCDVSGSMHAYARAFLQLAHALAARDSTLELYAFATRLTRLTPYLHHPTSDESLARMGAAVVDWDSGTRIGAAFEELMQSDGQRVLGARSLVVLLSDGLERGDPGKLREAAGRLRRRCRDLIWVNPLLRYDEYQPIARGAAALADSVEAIRPAHDPASLVELVRALAAIAADASADRPAGSASRR